MSWDESKEACASLASDSSLAKITTEEENNFVIGKYLLIYIIRECGKRINSKNIKLYLDLMKKVDKDAFGYWMGANDIETEGSFTWLDGSKGFTIYC